MADEAAPAAETTALATRPAPRQLARVESVQPLFDTDRMEHFQRAATALMHSTLLPESIRGTDPKTCFSNLMLVFDLSERWKIPALAVAQSIAIVHNKIVYEGKLISAMLSAAGVDLFYHYTGDRGTPQYRIYVSDRDFAELTDEALAALAPGKYPRGWRMIDGSVAEWQTFGKARDGQPAKVSGAWTGAAQHNQLAYRGAREFTRLYESALLLGVYGEDEMQAYDDRVETLRDVTPASPAAAVGFTRAAPADTPAINAGMAAAIEEAEAQEAAAARDQALAGRLGAVTPAADKGPDTAPVIAPKEEAAKDPAAPADPKKPAPKKAATPKAPSEEALQAAEAAGLAVGLAGEDGTPPATLKTPQEQEAWVSGWHEGAAERATGPDQAGDDAPADEESEFAEDEEGDDDAPHGNEMLDAIAEVEPELVEQVLEDHGGEAQEAEDGFAEFRSVASKANEWAEIASALTTLSRDPVWKEALAARDRRPAEARAFAWEVVAGLQEEGVVDRTLHLQDIVAYRCWLEAQTVTEAVIEGWQDMALTPLYAGLADDRKKLVEDFTQARINSINAAAAK